MRCLVSKALIFLITVIVLSVFQAAQADPGSRKNPESQNVVRQQPQALPVLMDLYSSIYDLTQSPPSKPVLVKTCEANVDERYITFIGLKQKKSFIVALTNHRLLNPSQDISLEVLYEIKRGLPHPIGYDPRSKSATMDWGYVFDRNGDGRIDYLAYLESPLPERPKDHKGELPKILGEITGKAFKMAIRNTRMVFWHITDQNFDRRLDGVIVPLRDESTGWIDSTLFAIDANFDGEYEQCSYFENTLLGEPHSCAKRDATYYVHGKQLMGLREVPPRLDLLKEINQGAAECDFDHSAFYKGDDDIRKEFAIDR